MTLQHNAEMGSTMGLFGNQSWESRSHLRQVSVFHVCADLLHLDHVLAGGSVDGYEEGGDDARQEGPDACASQEGRNRHPAITGGCGLLFAIPYK